MKFSVAWASIATQNVLLKWGVVSLALTTLCLTFSSVKLALRDPLIIERTCYSSIQSLGQAKHTKTEITSFLREAISLRFDSDQISNSVFLSKAAKSLRVQEQKELKRRSLRQKIIVNSIEIKDEQILIDADRLISVNDVRSAFKFPLKVEIRKTTRSKENPYGLVLNQVELIKSKEDKKNGN